MFRISNVRSAQNPVSNASKKEEKPNPNSQGEVRLSVLLGPDLSEPNN